VAIGATLAVGLGASFVGFRVVRSAEQARAGSNFQLQAQDQVAAIQRELNALLEQVHSLAALYQSSQLVERTEFRSFVAHGLERRHAPLDLLWIERVAGSERTAFEGAARAEGLAGFEFSQLSSQGGLVPAALRDEYWVNWFIEPREHGTTVLGFDHAANPERLAALRQSRDAKAPVLVGQQPGSLSANSGSSPDWELLAVLPIFDAPAAANDTTLPALHGFVGAAFPLKETIETALALKPVKGLQLCVTDASLPPERRILYATSAAAQPASDSNPGPSDDLAYSAEVEFGGRTWSVTCSPDGGVAAAAVSRWSWAVLAAGLVLTLLLALSIRYATDRASLQHLVDAATIQLQRRNQSLAQEIHEHGRTVLFLRAHRERTERILDSALDALITMDELGMVTGWNPKAEEVFGWTKSEVLQKSLAELIIPPQHREAHRRGIEKYLATGEGPLINRRVEITALTRDGNQISVELTLAAIRQGEKVTFSAFLRDITSRKTAELRQTALLRELERQVKSHGK